MIMFEFFEIVVVALGIWLARLMVQYFDQYNADRDNIAKTTGMMLFLSLVCKSLPP